MQQFVKRIPVRKKPPRSQLLISLLIYAQTRKGESDIAKRVGGTDFLVSFDQKLSTMRISQSFATV